MRELVAISDQLIDAAGAEGSPAVLVVQFDVGRDDHVFRWSCDDRSIGFRRSSGTEPLSSMQLQELLRTWQESEHAPGSTAATAEKAMQIGDGTIVVRSNSPD